jgi:uncharacterized protein YbgA (DUF1722 family)
MLANLSFRYTHQLLDATNRQLLEQMLQDYREGKETDERVVDRNPEL